MVKSIFSLAILVVILKDVMSEEVLADVQERIEVLKQEIAAEIEADQKKATVPPTPGIPSELYKYVTEVEASIKPIIQYRSKKRKHKHKPKNATKKVKRARSHKTTTASTVKDVKMSPKHTKDEDNVSKDKERNSPENPPPQKSKHIDLSRRHPHTPADVYYRRLFFDDEERNKPQKWTHCLDLITPFLNGFKDNLTTKQVDVRDGTVVRLIQLLSIDTTGHSKEDIVSILYQISNLRLRFFQWDVNALTTLFNVIAKHNGHSYKTLKAGLKEIFHKWHLDTTNVGTFLEQTRIFRPPCIAVSEHEGSTQSSKVSRYTTPQRKGSDSSCE